MEPETYQQIKDIVAYAIEDVHTAQQASIDKEMGADHDYYEALRRLSLLGQGLAAIDSFTYAEVPQDT